MDRPDAMALAAKINDVVRRILAREGSLACVNDDLEDSYREGRREASYQVARELLDVIKPFRRRN